jgi:hypothetical protein
MTQKLDDKEWLKVDAAGAQCYFNKFMGQFRPDI